MTVTASRGAGRPTREERAQDRMGQYRNAIRKAIKAGETRKVLHLAISALLSESMKVRRTRSRDGALIDVQLAASLLTTAGQLWSHKPARAGRGRTISADELLDAFEMACEENSGDAP